MAYINGNKPIVTNGLVYALDFGNTKSYVSGSNRAVSLAYDPAATAVTGSTLYSTNTPTGVPYSNGIISLSGSQWVARTGSFSFLDPNGTFTVAYVIRPRASVSGSILGQQTTTSNFNTEISPTSSTVGFYYENQSYSRTITGLSTASFQYVVYRYNSGSIDFFINGVPVTSSAANNPVPNFQGLNNLFIGAQAGLTRFANSSLYNFLLYNRALTADEVYNNYLVFAGRFGMSAVPKPYSLDENVYQFVQASGITDSNTQTALSNFVSGLKVNGLWNKLIAIYPFVGSTTSSQALNLKEPGVYRAGYTGSWALSTSGSTGNSTASLSVGELAPTTLYPGYNSSSAHLTYLSYDLPQSSSYLMGAVSYTSGSGGQIIITGSRTYHVFTSSATFSAITPGAVEVLMVGGGGGAAGGNNVNAGGIGGGGGAGGVVYTTSLYVTASDYIITVGSGGASPLLSAANGITGQNTTFGPLIAFGGGGGGRVGGNISLSGGSAGGIGGRGDNNTLTIGSGVVGQGNNGGSNTVRTGSPIGGGGGGGAGQVGGDANNVTGAGGNGGSGSYFSQYAILTVGSGSPAGWYAGGGGGGMYSGTAGRGGPGGGGNGNNNEYATQPGDSGSVNTGGGGGCGGYTNIGGPGGSGIVIISYLTTPTSSFALKITETSLTGSLNSPETSAITASGNIGLVTVSRKQAGILSLHKNTVSASFGTAGDFLPFPNLYLNAANNAGTASGITPSTIAFASVGAGLTTTEVATYHNLIGQLQANLKRQNTLLDNYSGAAAAYSLRRIGPSNYFGPAIRVRRDSDNTLRDIGFTSDGQLDTVGLLDFVGVTGSGFVNTWYDQSGNGYDASQATTTAQPFIVTSGSIEKSQNRYTIRTFTGGFIQSNALPAFDYFSFYSLVAPITTGGSGQASYVGIGSGGSFKLFFGYGPTSPSTTFYNKGGSNGNTSINMVNDIRKLITVDANFNNLVISLNGVLENTQNVAGITGGGTVIKIGNGYSTETKPSLQQELILYTSSRRDISSNINSSILSAYTTGSDTDYQSFITATGITQPTQSAALETLVSDLKSYGLWNKMKAIYPMITDKNNRFAYSQALATTWNAVNVYVTQSFITAPDGTLTGNFVSESVTTDSHYIYQTIADGLVTGSEYVASIHARFLNRPWIAMETNTGAKAWFNIQTGITGSLTGSNATITSVGSGWYRCALYFTSSVASGPQNIQYNLADANGNLSYAGVAGTGSYLWGAQFENGNVLGPYRATTATGFTTGSMLDQMKFNLKNTGSFSGSYVGNWNPGYSGNKPLGGYADTNLNPVTTLSTASAHFYLTLRNSIIENGTEIGNDDSAFIVGGFSTSGLLDMPTTTDRISLSISPTINNKGNYLVMLNSNSRKVLRNQINVGQAGPATTNFGPSTIKIASGKYANSTKESAFATIGDGLTDYEAKALYWIVQKYQTTLGRQVY
jgi:hypothetical protein